MCELIYVFSEADKDYLIAKGCTLLDMDENNCHFILVNDGNSVEHFSLDGIECIRSNVLAL